MLLYYCIKLYRDKEANKEYSTSIMIGEETYKLASDMIYVRQLDLLRVKGKTEPAKVYELVGVVERGLSDDMNRILELFGKGFDAYLLQNWEGSIKYFQQVLALEPKDGPSLRYVQRCRQFQENPPGDNWDGVFTMTTK